MLWVTEIFYSLQGESSWAGYPCLFIRLSGCNLRCRYCDTRYSYADGTAMSVESILQAATEQQHRMMLAEVTGGEPLLQPESVTLLDRLCSLVPTVLCETNGTVAIPPRSDRRWHAIMDIKCPGSGHHHQMCRDNLQRLAAPDEVKFVISDRADFEWAAATLAELGVLELGITVLFSPVTQTVAPGELARWILESGLHVKFQLQLHKLLWPDVHRGV